MRQRISILAVIVLVMSLVACQAFMSKPTDGTTDPKDIMPPWDKAQVFGMEAKAIIEAAHWRAEMAESSGDAVKIAFYRKNVNPIVNDAADIVADYLDLCADWEDMALADPKAGATPPAKYRELSMKVQQMLIRLAATIGKYVAG